MKPNKIPSRDTHEARPSPTTQTPIRTSERKDDLILSSKIRETHFQRKAMIYIRQSTPQQVLDHRESTDRQYALADRAGQLGWARDLIEIVDEDQGQSGGSVTERFGFQHLLAEIALNHVGIVMGLEMSRLARSNTDWHQLLKLCANFYTLLADQDGLYDPTDFNDRLLLGLKGTMSEAELHILQSRLNQGLLNKARRGEVFIGVPCGYVKVSTREVALDPDEQAQSVIRLIFDQFDRLGTVVGVLKYLVRNGIRMPVRPITGPNRGQLEWHRPRRSTLQGMLHHPIYAGYYRWGGQGTDPRRRIPGHRWSGRFVRSPKDSLVLLEGRCPAYITADRFWANQRQLEANRAKYLGAPRHGPALLSGLLVCGRCGCHLTVAYTNAGNGLRYRCTQRNASCCDPLCQSLSGTRLDAWIGNVVLEALQPAAVELHLAAAADIDKERERLHRHWKQQRERVRQQADRAARQYETIEPENRLVGRELGRRWEAALAEQRRIEEEYQQFCQDQPAILSEADREKIRSLSNDIPELWNSATTTPEDRQRVLRLLIERMRILVQGETDQVEVTIHWAGGFVSEHRFNRSVRRYEQMANYEHLCNRIKVLCAEGRSRSEIAATLNKEDFHPPNMEKGFTAGVVGRLMSRSGNNGSDRLELRKTKHLRKGEWLIPDLARELGMPRRTLYAWREAGWVTARKLPTIRMQWAIWAPKAELRRLARLYRHQSTQGDHPVPAALTTPKPQPGSQK